MWHLSVFIQVLVLSGHDHDQCSVSHVTKSGSVKEVCDTMRCYHFGGVITGVALARHRWWHDEAGAATLDHRAFTNSSLQRAVLHDPLVQGLGSIPDPLIYDSIQRHALTPFSNAILLTGFIKFLLFFPLLDASYLPFRRRKRYLSK